jgi:hypothetical protein
MDERVDLGEVKSVRVEPLITARGFFFMRQLQAFLSMPPLMTARRRRGSKRRPEFVLGAAVEECQPGLKVFFQTLSTSDGERSPIQALAGRLRRPSSSIRSNADRAELTAMLAHRRPRR